MKTIRCPEFKPFPNTVTEYLAQNGGKTVFVVETEKTRFEANDLNTAMKMWKASKDNSEVVNVVRVG